MDVTTPGRSERPPSTSENAPADRSRHQLDDQIEPTPLHLAARYGRTEIVSVLIAGGAAVNPAAYRKNTPLHWAAEYGHVAVVKEQLKAGADWTKKNDLGRTPLQLAIERGKKEVEQILRQAGAK